MADYVATLVSVTVPTLPPINGGAVEQHNANLVVVVSFSNGVRTSTRTFTAVNLGRDLRFQCRKVIADLITQDADIASLAPLIGQAIKV